MIKKSKMLLFSVVALGIIFALSKLNFGNNSNDMVLQVSADKKKEVDVVSTSAYKQEYEVVQRVIPNSSQDGEVLLDYSGEGISWMINKVSDPQDGEETIKYMNTYNQFGEMISQTEVPGTRITVPGTPAVYQYGGYATPGAYFRAGHVTRYGFDCGGCNINDEGYSRTALGINLNGTSVQQSSGAWQEGITYDGYYIIATSSALPMGTVVEISNHTFSGAGLVPGVPFRAIVGDRGVGGNAIDLFIGSEHNMSRVTQGYGSAVTVEVVH